MKSREHLSDETIAAYRKAALPAKQQQAVGRHLLFCESCRKLAPPLTKEQILKAVLGEEGKPGRNK